MCQETHCKRFCELSVETTQPYKNGLGIHGKKVKLHQEDPASFPRLSNMGAAAWCVHPIPLAVFNNHGIIVLTICASSHLENLVAPLSVDGVTGQFVEDEQGLGRLRSQDVVSRLSIDHHVLFDIFHQI